MIARVLQHVPFEGLGHIARWLDARSADIRWTRLHAGDAVPDSPDADLIIALGGPMSVNDEHEFPWLRAEKAFLRRAVERGGAVLGICLGAQLIASSFGARVYPNREREIGWFDIEGLPGGPDDFPFAPRERVFHWHGETFDLPPGARPLARSAACEHQAFQIGPRTLGLQFHLETTPASARQLVEHARRELTAARFVQSERDILGAPDTDFERIHRRMADVLDYLTRRQVE